MSLFQHQACVKRVENIQLTIFFVKQSCCWWFSTESVNENHFHCTTARLYTRTSRGSFLFCFPSFNWRILLQRCINDSGVARITVGHAYRNWLRVCEMALYWPRCCFSSFQDQFNILSTIKVIFLMFFQEIFFFCNLLQIFLIKWKKWSLNGSLGEARVKCSAGGKHFPHFPPTRPMDSNRCATRFVSSESHRLATEHAKLYADPASSVSTKSDDTFNSLNRFSRFWLPGGWLLIGTRKDVRRSRVPRQKATVLESFLSSR